VQPLDAPDAGAQTVGAVAAQLPESMEPLCDHASDHSVIQTRKLTDREVVGAVVAILVLTG
jgi:hypothetical protein